MKKRNKHQTLDIDEIVLQRPILTEEDMKNFCTYEEIVAEAEIMFNEKVVELLQQYNRHNNEIQS